MPSLKISQLPPAGSVSENDLCEVSHYLGDGLYTSSKATYSQVSDFVYLYQGSQVGGISGSVFSGSPLSYQVVLPTAYPNEMYAVIVTGDDSRMWSITSKTPSTFIISSNSNVPFYGYVYWRTEPF